MISWLDLYAPEAIQFEKYGPLVTRLPSYGVENPFD